jgi:Ca2+-transporting ATPase
LGAVVLNTLIGFLQEYRAGRAIEALVDMVPETATVIRDGQPVQVKASELVPGDVVTLASGDKVPADMRLLGLRNLKVEEAPLTGESVPVEKTVDAVQAEASLGDRRSMAYGGTLVSYGTGTGVVVGTGGRTELGRISALLQDATELQTPLTQQLAKVGKGLTVAILIVAALLFVTGMLRGYSFGDASLAAVILAVGAIPEGLPAIVTIALAIGVQRMARRKAVIRHLPAVETLGSTTVICTDRRAPWTRNEMTVQALWTPCGTFELSGVGYAPEGALTSHGGTVEGTPDGVRELLVAGALCNDARLNQEGDSWQISGDPTEAALLVAARKLGFDDAALRKEWPRLDAIPFESERQFMATLHGASDDQVVFLKGAPEVILSHCENVPDEGEIHAEIERIAARGMRVLAFAKRRVEASQGELHDDDVREGFTFLGLQGMIDPPRPEAVAAVAACHRAGIAVKMITGDHKVTARAIGEELGLGSSAISGAELERLNDHELRLVATKYSIFARVAPEHKLRLVRALQAEGHVVAMTGDGVNDAPALKQADIGVAMGITGTSVSKEAADMVLVDDNFASITAAVEEGRRVYDNLIKALAFVLPTNLGLAAIFMVAVGFFPVEGARRSCRCCRHRCSGSTWWRAPPGSGPGLRGARAGCHAPPPARAERAAAEPLRGRPHRAGGAADGRGCRWACFWCSTTATSAPESPPLRRSARRRRWRSRP